MGRLKDDYALVLKAGNTIQADLARNLFTEAGIPCLVHGPDFDVAEMGIAAHNMARGTNLYVPHGLREQAREVLQAAWGPIDEDGRPSSDGGDAKTA
ncbi:MAG TPA: DUF2007 domain-containing protein [Planctomycetota bacterium]|nr:DUF2007 domain-containing protein [Planctomycetota bacterium]